MTSNISVHAVVHSFGQARITMVICPYYQDIIAHVHILEGEGTSIELGLVIKSYTLLYIGALLVCETR